MSLLGNSNFDYHLQPNEKNQIERLVPFNQAKIHLAFRANISYSKADSNTKKDYNDSIVALSEHMITICFHGFFGRSYKLFCTIHVNEILEMYSKSDDLTIIKTVNGTYYINSPASLRFARNVVRNYILSNPMMPPKLRFLFKAEDPSKFPRFNPPLSPSQQFQFTYNASCSYFNVTYYHDIPRYFHKLMSTGSCIFDFTQLPIHLMECGLGQSSDIRPITSALMFEPYIYGLNISDISRADIISASAPVVLMNPSLRIVRLIKTRAQSGAKMLSNAMNQSRHQNVVYWDLSDNKLSDVVYFADSLSRYKGQLVTLRMNNCKMSNSEVTTLLTSLTDNDRNHDIMQLALVNNSFNQANCDQICYFLNLISSSSSIQKAGSENSDNEENNENLGEKEFNDIENDNENDDPTAQLIRRSSTGSNHSPRLDEGNDAPRECKLYHLELGPVKNPGIIIQSLNDRNIPLQILKIVDSSFDDDSVRHFSNFLNSTTKLVELDISGSKLKDQQLKTLLESLLTNSAIEEGSLKLGLNRLNLKGVRYEAVKSTLIEHQEKIGEISLNSNGITAADTVITDLGEFTNLKKVSLSSNFTKKMVGIGSSLATLLDHSNIVSLNISGNCQTGQMFGGYALETEAIPFIRALYTNSSLEDLDISGNLIGDEGVRLLNEVVGQSSVLRLINIDNNGVTSLQIIEDFLDAVSSSKTMIDYVFPVDDIYNILSNDPRLADDVEELSKKRQIAQHVTLNNMSSRGLYSSLSLLNDKSLDDVVDDCTLDLQEKFAQNEVQLEKHAKIAEIVGVPLPYEDEKESEKKGEVNEVVDDEEAKDGEEVYASKNLMDTVVQPEGDVDSSNFLSSFRTLQFNSLCIRRPDAEERLEEKGKFILQDVQMSKLVRPSNFKDQSGSSNDENEDDDNDNRNNDSDDDDDEDAKEEYINPTEF